MLGPGDQKQTAVSDKLLFNAKIMQWISGMLNTISVGVRAITKCPIININKKLSYSSNAEIATLAQLTKWNLDIFLCDVFAFYL